MTGRSADDAAPSCPSSPGRGQLLWQPVIALVQQETLLGALEALLPEAPRGPDGRPGADGRRASVAAALQEAEPFARLGVDVILPASAAELAGDASFPDFLEQAAAGARVDLARVVVELRQPDCRLMAALVPAVEKLRASGTRILLGTDGSHAAVVESLLALRPDFVRVGASLVPRCGSDFYRQALLEAVCEVAWKFGASIIAGSVEGEADLAMLKALGVRLVHGGLFWPALPQKALSAPAFSQRFPCPARRKTTSFHGLRSR